MKRSIFFAAALLLAAVVLAGCAEPPEGSIEDNVYTCESMELAFTAPEGWMYDWKYSEMTEGVPCDMCAYDNTRTGTEVAVAYEDLAATRKKGCDEEEYLDKTKEMLMDDPDRTFEFSDYWDAKIGGNTFKVMAVTFPDGHIGYNYVRRIGKYMIRILAWIPEGGDVDSVMANFFSPETDVTE